MAFIISIVFLAISMVSCSSPSERPNKSLGYDWSSLYNDSLFLFEKGILVITPDRGQTGFMVFSEDSSRIELFLPHDSVEMFVRNDKSEKWLGEKEQEIVFESKIWTVKAQDKVIYRQPITECEPALGPLEINTYKSVLADNEKKGAHYILSIRNQAHNGDGIFQLIRTWSDTHSRTDSARMDWGIRYTLRGMVGNNDATIWQCRSNSGEIFNFFHDDNETIVLLNPEEQFTDTLKVCRF